MYIKQALRLYREHFIRILFLGVLVVFPVQLLSLFITNYFYSYYGLLHLTIIADYFYLFIVLLGISFVQIPFIQLAIQHIKREEISFPILISSTLENGFVIYVMAIFYALLSVVGGLFLVIPGIIVIVLLFAFPYVVVIEKEKWIRGFKIAYQFGKQNFLRILAVIFIYSLSEWFVELIAQIITVMFTDRFIIIALVQLFLNMLFIPIFTFIATYMYYEWIEGDQSY